MGIMYLEVCAERRAHESLPEAHGSEALQVPPLSKIILQIGSSVVAHEETLNTPYLEELL